MNQRDKTEYEALNTVQERARWLLERGVTAKVTINPERMDLVAVPVAAGVVIPGEYRSESEAVVGGIDWLTEKADLSNKLL